MEHGKITEKPSAIQRVTPLTDYRLELTFTSGSLMILNMADRLDTIRYSPLADRDVFQSVATDGDTLLFGVKKVPAAVNRNVPMPDTVAAVEIPVLEAMRLAVGFPVWEDWEGEQ